MAAKKTGAKKSAAKKTTGVKKTTRHPREQVQKTTETSVTGRTQDRDIAAPSNQIDAEQEL